MHLCVRRENMKRQYTVMLLILVNCIALLIGIRVGYYTDWQSIGKPPFYIQVKELMENLKRGGAEVWQELPYRASQDSYDMLVLNLKLNPNMQNSILGMDLCYGSNGSPYIQYPEAVVKISDKQVFLYKTIGRDLQNAEIGINKSVDPGEEICIQFNKKAILEELEEKEVALVLQPISMIEKLCTKAKSITAVEKSRDMREKITVLNREMEKGTEYILYAPKQAGNYRYALKIIGSDSCWYYFFITVKGDAQ